jgi:glycosyltransferase involved in cell wall biosynthesis
LVAYALVAFAQLYFVKQVTNIKCHDFYNISLKKLFPKFIICHSRESGNPVQLRLSILADQLGSPVGGGRFIHGFITALLSDPGIMDQFTSIDIVTTQNESVECLGPLPERVSVVNRRFPSRLRQTPLAALFGYALPASDVAFGPFYYAFPSRTRARIVTIHDLSCFNDQYHPKLKVQKAAANLTRIVHECDRVVCVSNATLEEFKGRWPHLANKAVMIYNGVSPLFKRSSDFQPIRERSILAVGTIEPRKNYPMLLDAYEQLIREQGNAAPVLTVVGDMGWMSEHVEKRLLALQSAGKCKWLRKASDEQLAESYAKAGVFTYLSLYEGFGYPPFEAAYARCPMVLSNASSVGEIWSGHAKCVDPKDIEGIVTAWKWALLLNDGERDAVVDAQEKWALEFTWKRSLNEYVAFWKRQLS